LAEDTTIGGPVLASFKTLLHKVEARKDFLLLSRLFPPTDIEIKYSDVVSVEHRRLVDYGNFKGVIAGVAFAYIIMFIEPIRNIIEQLVLEVGNATGTIDTVIIDLSVKAMAQQVIIFITGFFIVVAGYYMIKFFMSLKQRLIIYRTGRKPVSIPMTLTGDAITLLAKINAEVKKAAGVSKKEVEKIIGEKIRYMLDKRVKMQKDMLESIRVKALVVKTSEDKQKLKELVEKSIEKLEEQDEIIGQELSKTGISKEEVFKKYRIIPPKKEFIDSVLNDDGLEGLLK